MNLIQIVTHAVKLGGTDLCAEGHAWVSQGGRQCPRYKDTVPCSQTVYHCSRCGCDDYGEPGGPAHHECDTICQHKDFATTVAPDLEFEPAPCAGCGASTEAEAATLCRSTSDETGERSCPGEFNAHGISVRPTPASIDALDRWWSENVVEDQDS